MPSTAGVSSLRGRRVLLAEDEFVLGLDLWQLFDMKGWHVLGPAATVDEALRLLASGPRPDAAVLGVELQGVRSVHVAEELLARGIPFVVTTAYPDLVEPIFAGILAFGRPCNTQQLYGAVARPLRGGAT
jgi:two-component system, response regulator PdtaR